MSSRALVSSKTAKVSSSSSKVAASSSKVQSSTKTYTYRSGGGGKSEDSNVVIEYHTDMSSMSRLEVWNQTTQSCPAQLANEPLVTETT